MKIGERVAETGSGIKKSMKKMFVDSQYISD
jgi:hypothetical protein